MDGGPYTLLFSCALCRREVRDYPNRSGREKHLAPLCRYCESSHGGKGGNMNSGAFMDRRKARQILALADSLAGEAYTLDWEKNHGYA